MLASNGVIAIKTAAKALATGRKGELIRVQNIDSKRIFEAYVTAPGEVEVRL